MKRLASLASALFLFAFATSARAADLTAGNSGVPGGPASDGYTGVEGTLIDLSGPATATGVLTNVRFGWGTNTCLSAHVKVFHRSGNTLTFADQRTVTFSSSDLFSISAALSPPLPVHQGDLLGIGGVGGCGVTLLLDRPFTGTYLVPGGVDFTGSVTFDPSLDVHNGGVAVSGTGTVSEYRAGVIPGVGSGPGLNGASFRTSLQMIAPVIGGDVTGRIVFHPVGVGGSIDDPSMDISIPHGQAIGFDDVVQAMGLEGFGTLDVIVSADSAIPVTLARIYNDQGSAGQSGLGEEMVAEAGPFSTGTPIMPAGFTGYLSGPVDPAKTRLNIGVRTLDSGAFVSFDLKDSAGNLKATSQSAFPPNYFNQFHAEQMFGMDLAANDVVEVSVSTGSAIVFGAATDNVTNDPSAQFVRPVFGVL